MIKWLFLCCTSRDMWTSSYSVTSSLQVFPTLDALALAYESVAKLELFDQKWPDCFLKLFNPNINSVKISVIQLPLPEPQNSKARILLLKIFCPTESVSNNVISQLWGIIQHQYLPFQVLLSMINSEGSCQFSGRPPGFYPVICKLPHSSYLFLIIQLSKL